jgi:hypothetical protein
MKVILLEDLEALLQDTINFHDNLSRKQSDYHYANTMHFGAKRSLETLKQKVEKLSFEIDNQEEKKHE